MSSGSSLRRNQNAAGVLSGCLGCGNRAARGQSVTISLEQMIAFGRLR